MNIGFDVLGDLCLTPDDEFNWEGKSTSLYCLIPGNISNDLKIVRKTLIHLSKFYQGVFYTMGTLEYKDAQSVPDRTEELNTMCSGIRNVASLHNHVILIDGVAVLGSNCWYNNYTFFDTNRDLELEFQRGDDLVYMAHTLGKLQLHMDVKSIVLLTNSVPGPELFFGEEPNNIQELISPMTVLRKDSENKVSHWAYGSYNKMADATLGGIKYVSNPYIRNIPYWPKRIEVEL